MPISKRAGRGGTEQSSLFELPPLELAAAAPTPEHVSWAASLPSEVRLGTMSWAYPGWRGLVYGREVPEGSLAQRGLAAYARHPLLGAVEIDRSYYEPLGVELLRAYAEQVPQTFRFLVKAHEHCTVQRYPLHARYGSKRGQLNPLYLDSGYATEAVVGPVHDALGARLGALLFQFSPSPQSQTAEAFASELGSFLARLPTGVPYAVELRTPQLLGTHYAEALARGGAVHCHNAWSGMPSILTQAKQLPPVARNPLVVRWLLAPGEVYADARDRFRPFDRITREDLSVRSAIARLVVMAAARGVPALVLINNKAEGCAPESAFRLAHEIVWARRAAATSGG